MRLVPERINAAWIKTLEDEDLIAVEERLYGRFQALDNKEKKRRGGRYLMFNGPAELLTAWDRWCRVRNALQGRSLAARRKSIDSGEEVTVV
jgi:hypothetical protein